MKGGTRRVLTFRDANSYPCTAGFKDRNFQKWDHCFGTQVLPRVFK